MKPVRPLFLLPLLLATRVPAQPANPFFAMDTIARGQPEAVVPLLRELGYAGLGGQAGDPAMAEALRAAGLQLFNGYLTLDLADGQIVLTDSLRRKIDAMEGSGGALWLAISKVSQDGKALARDSAEADRIAVEQLQLLCRYTEVRKVGISLYPHAGTWMEQVEHALRLANQLDRKSVNVTFNLCHWLKVEGAERDPVPVLKAALPRLDFVTINGADTGDTKNLGWDRLIQPLGQGSYDVAGFLQGLQRAGYTGPVGFQGFGIRGDPKQVLAESMAAWRRMK